MVGVDAQGNATVYNVYNNANKLFNLVRTETKSYPVGAVTFGAGSIGPASISTLAKDFRKRISVQNDPLYVDAENYSVQEVAEKFRQFIFDDKYNAMFSGQAEKPGLGFIIAGYSTGADLSEEYGLVAAEDGTFSGPDLLPTIDGANIHYFGVPEAVDRLLFGVSGDFPQILVSELAFPPQDAFGIYNQFRTRLRVRLEDAAMPIQDAIDLAEFLVDLTTKYIRFSVGAQTVGGPIEIATITKHEDFKWIRRKHFYKRELQPTIPPY